MNRKKLTTEILKKAEIKAQQAMEQFAQNYAPLAEQNFARVLDALRAAKISEQHLLGSTGYGYGDVGRDALEEVYAQVLGGEACLLRQQIVSGTHAITLALLGNLRPGQELLYLGRPYDTLCKVIGLQGEAPGSLLEMGGLYREIDFDFNQPNIKAVTEAIQPQTRILALQRSRGYAWRPALSPALIQEIITAVHQQHPEVIVFVDNCYGEFVCPQEPLAWGADLIAGSLIKNPGGGVAPGGGYVAGHRDLVERAAARLTAPGIGAEVGSSLLAQRVFYQGLFMAPLVVQEALCGAEFTAALFGELGFKVSPQPGEERSDIVQAIQLDESELLLAFCQGIQKYSPVDSYVRPEPWDMPGYTDQVIMASGAFISGSSIELSADAPVRPPYIAYFQGGLNRWHAKIAVTRTLQDMLKAGLL